MTRSLTHSSSLFLLRLSSITSPSLSLCSRLGLPGAEGVQLGPGEHQLPSLVFLTFTCGETNRSESRLSVVAPPDTGLRRHEPRVGGQRLAAQPGAAAVPQLLHGVPGGRPHAGPPDQEGAEGSAQDGGQLPPVTSLRPLCGYRTLASCG